MNDPIRLRTASDATQSLPLLNPIFRTDGQTPVDLTLPRVMIDPSAGPGRIDPDWALTVSAPPRPRKGAWGPFTGGVILLAGGWVTLSIVEFIADAFARGPVLGGGALLLLGGGFGAVFWGLYRELSGLRSLDRVDLLRAALDDGDTRAIHHARLLLKNWLIRVPDFPRLLIGEITGKIDAAPDRAGLRALLNHDILPMLDRKGDAAIDRASREIITLAALTPSGLLDAALFLWRAGRLVREIAGLYGLRPGTAGSWLILRRIFADASLVAAAEMGGNLAAQAALSNPILKHLAGDAAAAGIAGWRMARLGTAAASLCRILTKA